MDYESRQELNKAHVENPKAGDVWREMFCPYFMIVDVAKNYIVVLNETIQVGDDKYKFDETKPKLMTREEFKSAVTYKTMPNKFVADVTVTDYSLKD